MANFPSSLPGPMADFGGETEQAFLRTNMESGSARQRQIYSAVNQMVGVKWRLSAAQYATFSNFFKTTINMGAAWFTLNLDMGNGFGDYECRFVEKYQFIRLTPMIWEVSAKLEVRGA